MKVILLHNVKKIGEKGEIHEVADGYANGFLLPKRLAKPATNDAVKQLKNELNQVIQATESEKKEDQKVFLKIHGKEVSILAQANNKGHLFAAVTQKDIAIAIQNDHGAIIEPESIILKEGIKDLGNYKIPLILGENKGNVIVKIESK